MIVDFVVDGEEEPFASTEFTDEEWALIEAGAQAAGQDVEQFIIHLITLGMKAETED